MSEHPYAQLLRSETKASLQENLNAFKTIFQIPNNKDAVLREFCTCGFEACLIYIEGMAGGDVIDEDILEPCLKREKAVEGLSGEDRANYLTRNVLEISQVETENRVGSIVDAVLDGRTALLVDGCAEALILETRKYEKREVSRTNTESVVIGGQQGFIENLRSNLTLIHRILRTPMLTTEMLTVGKQLPTAVSLVYLRGVASKSIVDRIRQRIQSLDVDSVPNSGQLQQLIEDHPFMLLPQMLQTERPDRAADCIANGQVAIMVDNSPYALIAPVTLFHLLHTADDTYMRWQYASFNRIIRVLGILLSLLLPGIYVALTMHHPHMIPMDLLTSIAETRAKVPFPVLVEALIMEFSFYLINEASTRIPSQIGPVLGIVGALILGQAAVAADIISPILIIIVALTGLGNYAMPTYSVSLSVQILRLGALFAGAMVGLYGIVLVSFLYLCALCSITSFGEPFIAPVAPWRPHNPDLLLRLPLWMQKRLTFYAKKNSWLKRTQGNVPERGWREDGK